MRNRQLPVGFVSRDFGVISLRGNAAPILSPEYVPENYFRPLEIDFIFPQRASLEVDLGCGDGSFLAEMARQHRERNFLGLERLLGRVRSATHKIAKVGIDNARVIRIESSYAVTHLIPARSVSTFYLLFPDPWPKRRHQRRRLVNEEFLQAVFCALTDDGLFVVATDAHDYFEEIERVAKKTKKFSVEPPNDLPTTTFEKYFRRRGLEIYRLALRKVSPVK